MPKHLLPELYRSAVSGKMRQAAIGFPNDDD